MGAGLAPPMPTFTTIKSRVDRCSLCTDLWHKAHSATGLHTGYNTTDLKQPFGGLRPSQNTTLDHNPLRHPFYSPTIRHEVVEGL